MTASDVTQVTCLLALFVFVTLTLCWSLSHYLINVFHNRITLLDVVLRPLERFVHRVCRIDEKAEQTWCEYLRDVLIFGFASVLVTYGLLRLQSTLLLNPGNLASPSPELSLNTAVSFVTNTDWQSYAGESTMSLFSQSVPLTLQNFLSAGVGLAVCVALIRALSRREAATIGNFWVDLVRGTLYVLLPLSLVLAVFLLSQGVIQNYGPSLFVTTLEGATQTLPQGPVASQVAIKMLGTNGGGFFNANAAHPFENPGWFSNFVQMVSIFLIPGALVLYMGEVVKNRKHGWSILGAMVFVFLVGAAVCMWSESAGNPLLTKLGAMSSANLEGKELRFGTLSSGLFAAVTTDASCGAVNAMHASLTPLATLVTMLNMLLGEIIFGGVGSGLYGMVLFIILTVFIAGLMVGRTPEYLGKKIEAVEVKFAMLAVIATALPVLGLSAWAMLDHRGLSSVLNGGPRGFAEILYAYTSAGQNNGSALAGLSANTPFWNLTLSVAMFMGRFFVISCVLAVAGSLVRKRVRPENDASFPVHGLLFSALLVGLIFIVGALTFFPALSLGPIVEHFAMHSGKTY